MSRGAQAKPGTRRRRSGEPVALLVPPDVRLRVSDEGFWRLCRENPDLRLERTARGGLIVMAPAGTESGRRNSKLTMRLGVWAEADGTGEHFDSSTGFRLPDGYTRSPDASWVRKERWNALAPEQKEGFAPICPDFAVELCSSRDEKEATRRKMGKYLANGLRLGWLIDPWDGTVEVYRPGRPVETLQKPATLSGEGVLPGFVLDLKGILFD
jgi:Uma2 family endonuclease